MNPNDAKHLLAALDEAKKRRGFCSPNPSVGAVLVSNGQEIAKGFHLQAGAPHAEVMTLSKIDIPKDSTLYVTLEPCCHFGKTPPCTDLIVSKKVSRVVFGFQDPNPIVAGKGKKTLEERGIPCTHVELPEINQFYESYAHWTKTKRPFVTAKLAMTLDSKIAEGTGRPLKITGEKLDKMTHLRRKHADAILTTVKTILKDDPKLNVRFDGEVIRKTLYILDRRLDLPLNATVFATTEKITVFCDKKADPLRRKDLETAGVEIIDSTDLDEILKTIGAQGKHDLWVEAGGTLFAELINQKLAQSALIYIAPFCLKDGYPAFSKAVPDLSVFRSATWHAYDHETCLELR